MQRISSDRYPLTRNLVPLLKRPLVLVVAGVIAILLIVSGLWILLAIPLLGLGLLLSIHTAPTFVLKNFCRDAWIDEDGIQLHLKDERILLPFSQIEKFTWHGSNNPPRAKVWLRSPSEHGNLFTFIPDLRQGRRVAQQEVEALNDRLGEVA